MFPVTRVDGLGEGAEVREGVGFADTGNLILDSGWESSVQLLVQGSFAPLDMGSKLIEVDEVLHYVLVFMHMQIFKIAFAFTFRFVWSEVFPQLQNKVGVVVEPGQINLEGNDSLNQLSAVPLR